jgi:hypothetical protein
MRFFHFHISKYFTEHNFPFCALLTIPITLKHNKILFHFLAENILAPFAKTNSIGNWQLVNLGVIKRAGNQSWLPARVDESWQLVSIKRFVAGAESYSRDETYFYVWSADEGHVCVNQTLNDARLACSGSFEVIFISSLRSTKIIYNYIGIEHYRKYYVTLQVSCWNEFYFITVNN